MWRSIDLSHAAASKRWSGGGLFSGTAAEWFIQAVDQNGNVGVISNKATIDPVTLPAPTGGISAVVTVVPPGTVVNGWFKGDATVTITGAPGITSSLDGAAVAPNSVVTVSGTGLHMVGTRAPTAPTARRSSRSTSLHRASPRRWARWRWVRR